MYTEGLWLDIVTKVDADVLSLPEYGRFIQDLKRRVSESRLVAARAVNRELILLYWDIGKAIAGKLEEAGWGESVVNVVSRGLRASFPGISGFSSQNVWRMLQFYRVHTDPHFLEQIEILLEREGRQAASDEKVSQVVREMVARVPWGHHALCRERRRGGGVCLAEQSESYRGRSLSIVPGVAGRLGGQVA
jgi:hypothetical protein